MKPLDISPSQVKNAWLQHVRDVAFCMLGGILFGLVAYEAISLTRGDGRIAAVWIPNAIAVAYLLRARLGKEILLLAMCWLGNIGANLFAGDNLARAAGLASCNSIEIILALLLARRFCKEIPDMQDLGDLARFVILAAIIAPMITALPAAFILEGTSAGWLAAWAKWSVTDGLGMAIVAPAGLVISEAWAQRKQPSQREFVEWLTLSAFGIVATVMIFTQTQYPLLFFAPLVVVFQALRLGALCTALSVFTTAIIASFFTSLDLGPLALISGTETSKLIVLQCFVATIFIIGLPVSAALSTRARLIEELASRTRELDLLTENISDAVLFYDCKGVCTYASPSVADVLDEAPEIFVGSRASARMHTDARAKILEAESRLLSGETDKDRITYRRYNDSQDGKPVYIEADCAAARNPETGEIKGIIISARDVTERVELELQLVRARHHAENAAHAKSEFLANMSREIRTPMNGVLSFAELLLQGELDEKQERHAELIVQSGRSMMLLLNDILDLSRIEAGQIAVNPEPTDPATILEECSDLHRPAAEKKGVKLVCETGGATPSVLTDGLRLRQILLNLIGNAVKFTPDGTISVSMDVHPEQFVLTVEDTGIGIGADRLERIFNPFDQRESDTAGRFGGTGLGLPISRQLAELLGGTLEVESTPGEGSRFSLALPLVECAPAPQPRRRRPIESCVQLPRKSRILLAEDHPVNRLLATEMLERCHQHVSATSDGDETVEAVLAAHARGEPFDLVLMDIQMPGCDGYTATRIIRGEGFTPTELPIIALTANVFPEDVAAARDAGMQGHLAKPLVFDELVGALRRWLPVSIVDQSEIELEMEMRTAPVRAVAEQVEADLEAENEMPLHDAALHQVWRQRRAEAINAVAEAMRAGRLTGIEGSELGKLVQKLAGSAGIFGEDELGSRASAFARALSSEVDEDVRFELAREFLEAA